MMQEFQTAQIDSNGNGIAGEKADKTLAQDLVLGRGYVPALDKPFTNKRSNICTSSNHFGLTTS